MPIRILSISCAMAAVLPWTTSLTLADPPDQTQEVIGASIHPWGRVEPVGSTGGRFLFVVEHAPDDGRIPVPLPFAEVISARLGTGESADLPIEISQDAQHSVLILPAQRQPITESVAVDVATGTTQFDDGRIVLTASTARVEGGRAKLESQPGNSRIGFWTDPDDSIHWKWRATRWGRYDARLTFSNADAAGSSIQVVIGDETVEAELPSTGSWYRYRTLRLGPVSLRRAGDLDVTVRCTKLAGAAVMNLKAITLEPACEGRDPVQDDDGVITLHGRDATVHGTLLRYEPAEVKQTLGYWTRSTDSASWTFSVTRPGEFDIEVLQGCGTGQGGSRMRVAVDEHFGDHGTSLTFEVEDTGGFQAFRPRIIGRIDLAAGSHAIRVIPERIAKAAACDIRQLRLIPVVTRSAPNPR